MPPDFYAADCAVSVQVSTCNVSLLSTSAIDLVEHLVAQLDPRFPVRACQAINEIISLVESDSVDLADFIKHDAVAKLRDLYASSDPAVSKGAELALGYFDDETIGGQAQEPDDEGSGVDDEDEFEDVDEKNDLIDADDDDDDDDFEDDEEGEVGWDDEDESDEEDEAGFDIEFDEDEEFTEADDEVEEADVDIEEDNEVDGPEFDDLAEEEDEEEEEKGDEEDEEDEEEDEEDEDDEEDDEDDEEEEDDEEDDEEEEDIEEELEDNGYDEFGADDYQFDQYEFDEQLTSEPVAYDDDFIDLVSVVSENDEDVVGDCENQEDITIPVRETGIEYDALNPEQAEPFKNFSQLQSFWVKEQAPVVNKIAVLCKGA